MKQLIKLGIISNLLMSTPIFALDNPVDGFYVGILAGISHGPTSDQVIFHEDGMLFTGTVSYSNVGAFGGATFGYKLSHFRAEGELFYNRFSTGPLKVGTCTIQNRNIASPTGICTPGTYDSFEANGEGYSGSSTATYGMINLYYDFFTPNSHTNVVPYFGIGLGEARIRNFSDFVYTTSPDLYSHGSNVTYTTPAAQGILGASYFMDDFTWAGLDLRYNTTKNSHQAADTSVQHKKYTVTSLNFNINFAFDKGGFNN